MQVANLLNSVDEWIIQPDFIELLESHMTWVASQGDIQTKSPDGQVCAKYRGDYYGLLISQNIPISMHYLTLRFNNMTSSSDFDGEQITIFVPSEASLKTLVSIYRTKKGASIEPTFA